MTIGSLDPLKRLGIANCSRTVEPQYASAGGFGYAVLRLPADSPIYQQQLVRSTALGHGPEPAAMETCCAGATTDLLIDHHNVLRQISVHDSIFSRRNIRSNIHSGTRCAALFDDNPYFHGGPDEDPFPGHAETYVNHIYYVNNEPEIFSALRNPAHTDGGICGGCWDPRSWAIDIHVAKFFTNTAFWEDKTDPDPRDLDNPGISFCRERDESNWRRITARAMAWVYLTMRNEMLSLNRGHLVIAPSAAKAAIGSGTDPFWRDFYTAVRDGVEIGGYPPPRISAAADLRVLHVHDYAPHPTKVQANNPIPSSVPLGAVAWSVNTIRRGAKWIHTDLYNITGLDDAGKLPLDLLISEMGLSWPERDEENYDPKLIAGYYNNYRDGLVWWNSWLCWLTRLAPSECNLTSSKTAYGCLHIPDREPYVTQTPPAASRTQIYFHADTWAVTSQPNMAALDHTIVQNNIGNQQYQNKVTSNTAILWPNTSTSWYAMPLGICYTVWAQVGPKPVTGDFSTGWIQNTQAGVITTAQISLPAGWSTVYFPVIKYAAANSTFPVSTQINIDWIRTDGFVRAHGYMDLNDIPDGASYNDFANIKKWVFPAMIYPVVCKKGSADTVTIRLRRNTTGPIIWLGPPVVLAGACSWLVGQ
jgi:hypothetical protein